jgi:hypothetical protein
MLKMSLEVENPLEAEVKAEADNHLELELKVEIGNNKKASN